VEAVFFFLHNFYVENLANFAPKIVKKTSLKLHLKKTHFFKVSHIPFFMFRSQNSLPKTKTRVDGRLLQPLITSEKHLMPK